MFVSAYINTISCPPFQTSFHHNLKFIKTRGIHTLASRHFSPNSKHITQYIRTHSKVVSAIRSCGALPSDYLPLGHSVAGAWDDLWLFAYVYIPIGSVQAYRGSGWLASCAEGAPSDGFGDSVIRATTALIQSTFSHSVTLIRPDCCLRGHTRHFAREKFWAYVGASYLQLFLCDKEEGLQGASLKELCLFPPYLFYGKVHCQHPLQSCSMRDSKLSAKTGNG